MCTSDNPYRTLGIEPDATIEEIKDAYRRAAKTWHPDVSNATPAESERQFHLITNAYKHAMRNALITAANVRKARQSQANSGSSPHADCPRYTPPEPSPHQRRCQPRPGHSRRLALRHIKKEIGIALAAILLLIPLSLLLIPSILHLIHIASMDPEEADRYYIEQEEREQRRKDEEQSDPNAARYRSLRTYGYYLLSFGLAVLTFQLFRYVIRPKKPSRHLPPRQL